MSVSSDCRVASSASPTSSTVAETGFRQLGGRVLGRGITLLSETIVSMLPRVSRPIHGCLDFPLGPRDRRCSLGVSEMHMVCSTASQTLFRQRWSDVTSGRGGNAVLSNGHRHLRSVDLRSVTQPAKNLSGGKCWK